MIAPPSAPSPFAALAAPHARHDDLVALEARYGARNYKPLDVVLTRGEGAYVWDDQGNRYLDLLGGIAVNALGHGHPALVAAVTDQLRTLGHVSNFFATEPQVTLAERLLGLLGQTGHVFFTSSGTEANEAAFKLTRRTGRTHVVAAEGGFHGRTMGALALTSKDAYRAPFEPLPGEVTFVPYGDVDALAAAVTDATAAVLLEGAVQGGTAAAGVALGGIAVGQRADFAVIDADAPALAGIPAGHLLDALLFSSPDAGFRRSFVAGTEVEAAPDAETFSTAMRQLWSR